MFSEENDLVKGPVLPYVSCLLFLPHSFHVYLLSRLFPDRWEGLSVI